MTDEQVLLAKISGLENELRAMRETLRDKFAGQAMQGMLADGVSIENAELTEWSYGIADAMLEARK